MSLLSHLEKLYKSREYPLHMPGHKRLGLPGYLEGAGKIDITEIEGYDNLYEPAGILREALDFAGMLYNCPNTYYLVNGSTIGILASIYAVRARGKSIIAGSSCHRSVYAGAKLASLEVVRLPIEKDTKFDIHKEVDIDALTALIEATKKDEKLSPIAAVVITSPSYEGVISDIAKIKEICHNNMIPLLVDEAHGAHLGLDPRLPKGAISEGADIVVHSTHKTLASLTQTALLHVQGELVDTKAIEEAISMLQTSSPSYVLMASIDSALREIAADGERLFGDFLDRRRCLEADLVQRGSGLRYLEILNSSEFSRGNTLLDPCKLVISGKRSKISGHTLASLLLQRYGLQIEMTGVSYVVAILTYRDGEEGFRRIREALLGIDKDIWRGDIKEMGEVPAKSAFAAPCIPET